MARMRPPRPHRHHRCHRWVERPRCPRSLPSRPRRPSRRCQPPRQPPRFRQPPQCPLRRHPRHRPRDSCWARTAAPPDRRTGRRDRYTPLALARSSRASSAHASAGAGQPRPKPLAFSASAGHRPVDRAQSKTQTCCRIRSNRTSVPRQASEDTAPAPSGASLFTSKCSGPPPLVPWFSSLAFWFVGARGRAALAARIARARTRPKIAAVACRLLSCAPARRAAGALPRNATLRPWWLPLGRGHASSSAKRSRIRAPAASAADSGS